MRTPCPAKDHRRWPCHFEKGHLGTHVFDDLQEMAYLRARVTELETELATRPVPDYEYDVTYFNVDEA